MRPLNAILALFVVLAVTLALYGANILLGDLNQDEGWYLYAAGEVFDGRIPFRDFAFTQGPVFPLVYSLAYPVVERFGIMGGRLVTACFGLASALLAAMAAYRLAPRGVRLGAFLLCFLFLGVNVYHAYFTMVVKTYALCAFFLAAGVLLFTYIPGRGGKGVAVLSGFMLAMAAGVRISSGAALAVLGVYLLLFRKRVQPYAWVFFGGGGLAGLALFTLPFLALAPKGFLFCMFEYHTLRDPASSTGALLAYKAGFLSRFAGAYFMPCLAAAGLVLLYLLVRVPKEQGEDGASTRLWMNRFFWLTGGAVSLVHFAAPFPYDDYQVPVVPVLAAALAGSLARCTWRFSGVDQGGVVRRPLLANWLVWILVGGSCAAAGSSVINQQWFSYDRDRIWWPVKEMSPLQKLARTADTVKKISGGEKLLLTQDTYLAVEAGMKVPKGLEMGPFSYYPDFTREKAEAVKVVNREMMQELLEAAEAPAAAISGYGLSIRCPEVEELAEEEQKLLQKMLRSRYRLAETVPLFGQAFTDLKIYRRKPPSVAPKDKPLEATEAVEPAAPVSDSIETSGETEAGSSPSEESPSPPDSEGEPAD